MANGRSIGHKHSSAQRRKQLARALTVKSQQAASPGSFWSFKCSRVSRLYITQAAAVAIGPSTARLSPAAVAAPSWIRATRENDRLVVETASRAYTTPAGAKLTVRGVVHVAEEAYWRDVQNIEGRVLFESIVDASLIDEKGALTTSIAATDDARSAAASCSLVPQLDALGGTAKANDWRVADLTRAEIGGAEQRPSELRYLTRDVPKKERVEVTFGAAAARVLCALAPAPELAVAALDWQGGGKSVNTEAAARAVAAGVLRLDTGALSRLGLARALLAEAPARSADDVLIGKRNQKCVEAVTATEGDAHVLYGVAHLRDLDGRLRKAGYARQRGEDGQRRARAPGAPRRRRGGLRGDARGRGVRRRRGGARALRRAPRGALLRAAEVAAVLTKMNSCLTD